MERSGVGIERAYVENAITMPATSLPSTTSSRSTNSGQKRGITSDHEEGIRRRSAVEAVIGHLKTDGRLGRNFLKGRDGDKINAILAGAGYNYRLVLRWFRLLFARILAKIFNADCSRR